MFYKKDCIKLMLLGLNKSGLKECNKCVIKMSDLPLYCFAQDLSPVASKLNAKMVHVPVYRMVFLVLPLSYTLIVSRIRTML